MLAGILSHLRNWKLKRHLLMLCARGLKLGEHTDVYDGCFIDPAHCFLISIGNRCTLAPNVRIMAHDASMNDYIGVTKVGRVTIHDDCFIGDSAIVLPGVTIGPRAVVGAGTVVTKDVPPNCVVVGNPGRIIKTCEEFLSSHLAEVENKPIYPESQFCIEAISEERKEVMRQGLEMTVGYIRSRSKQHLK